MAGSASAGLAEFVGLTPLGVVADVWKESRQGRVGPILGPWVPRPGGEGASSAQGFKADLPPAQPGGTESGEAFQAGTCSAETTGSSKSRTLCSGSACAGLRVEEAGLTIGSGSAAHWQVAPEPFPTRVHLSRIFVRLMGSPPMAGQDLGGQRGNRRNQGGPQPESTESAGHDP